MDYQFKMVAENVQGDAAFSTVTIPFDIDLSNPPDEILETILIAAKETLLRLRNQQNVKHVDNLPKWF